MHEIKVNPKKIFAIEERNGGSNVYVGEIGNWLFVQESVEEILIKIEEQEK